MLGTFVKFGGIFINSAHQAKTIQMKKDKLNMKKKILLICVILFVVRQIDIKKHMINKFIFI